MATVVRHRCLASAPPTWRTQFNNIMDLLQLVFAFVNAPLFATFLLGMFWKRATGHGAFFGLLLGHARRRAAPRPDAARRRAGAASRAAGCGTSLHTYPSEMAQNFWTAIFAWTVCFVVTIVISLLTQRTKTDEELEGLVYSLTPAAEGRAPALVEDARGLRRRRARRWPSSSTSSSGRRRAMGLDIRTPIGLMFGIVRGCCSRATGSSRAAPSIYQRSLGAQRQPRVGPRAARLRGRDAVARQRSAAQGLSST